MTLVLFSAARIFLKEQNRWRSFMQVISLATTIRSLAMVARCCLEKSLIAKAIAATFS